MTRVGVLELRVASVEWRVKGGGNRGNSGQVDSRQWTGQQTVAVESGQVDSRQQRLRGVEIMGKEGVDGGRK